MELDITALLDTDVSLMSGSQHELGPNAAKITWGNSQAFAAENPIVTGIDLAISGPNRNDIKEYLHEVCHFWLTSEVE